MHKAKTVNSHLNACFFKHFTNNGLFCCFTEFQPAANGVEIVSAIANHQKLSVFHDDCAGTNIQNPVVTDDAHVFVHGSFSVPFGSFSVNGDLTAGAELPLRAAAIHIGRTSDRFFYPPCRPLVCMYALYNTEIKRFSIGVTEVIAMKRQHYFTVRKTGDFTP